MFCIDKPHTCELLCHEDECGTCTKQTVMKCRCGALEKSIPCTEIKNAATFKCQKKCSKVNLLTFDFIPHAYLNLFIFILFFRNDRVENINAIKFAALMWSTYVVRDAAVQ